nr:hypothetical protein CFP56_57032 [Quercus suber]
MGRPIALDGPSLDRLKALKSLPNVDLQFQEAQRLCTHSARADMILKWLLGVMKDSNDAIRTTQVWKLLESILRLLPFDRIAILLGASNIIGIMTRALADGIVSGDVFQSMSSSLGLLLDLSDNLNGTSLQAVVSAEASAAARFVRVWMRQCFSQVADPYEYIAIAVRVWNHRSQHPDENKFFSDDCLLWIIAVLSKVSSSSTKMSRKRKREDSLCVDQQDLESLVAKHVILPARMHFMNAQESEFMKRSKREQRPQMDLPQLLAPYNAVDEEVMMKEDFRTTWYSGAPLFLDLTLRCVPAPTVQHRTKERPWIEFVFISLAGLVGLDHMCDKNTIHAYHALVEMLSVIGKRATLPTELLRKVVHSWIFDGKSTLERSENSAHDKDEETVFHHTGITDVLQKVIELDASVFLEKPLLHDLTNHIRSSLRHECTIEPSSVETMNGLEKSDSFRALSEMVQNDMLEPILRIFARERRLLDFVDVWYEQLQQCGVTSDLPAWVGLGDAFSELMETTLPDQQILDVFDRFHGELEQKHAQIGGSSDASEFTAMLTILKSILKGIKREQLLNAMHTKIGMLLMSLVQILRSNEKQSERRSIQHSDIWTLCTLAFEVWYPKRAKEEADTNVLVSSSHDILTPDLVQRALNVSYNANERCADHRSAFKAAQQAFLFLGCLTDHLGGNEGNTSSLQAFAKQIVKRTRKDLVVLPVVLHYPSMMFYLSEKQRSTFLNELFHRLEETKDTELLTTTINTFCSMRSRLPTAPRGYLTDEIINVALQDSKSSHISKSSDQRLSQVTIIEILAALPTQNLSKSQNGTVVDALIKMPYTGLPVDPHELEVRFGLVIRLLEDKSPAAVVRTNPATFWDVAEQANLCCRSQTDDQGIKVYQLSSRLSYLVVKQLCENQAHEGCRITLGEVISSMEQRILAIRARWLKNSPTSLLEECGTLAFIDGIFQAASEHTSQDTSLPVFKPQVVENYIESVSQALENTKYYGYDPSRKNVYLSNLARALLSLTTVLQSMRREDLVVRVQQILNSGIKVSILPHISMALTGSDVNLIGASNAALHAIAQELQPHEFSHLVADFRELCVSRFMTHERVILIHHLLSKAKEETVISALTLAKPVLSSLEKSDCIDHNLSATQSILPATLLIASGCSDVPSQQAVLRFINTILREKPFITNQSSIESTVSRLQAVVTKQSVEGVIFLQLCSTLTLLLQQYRSRLSDRIHLVTGLLQALITPFFRSAKSRHVQPAGAAKQLTLPHARALARCLQLFCDPPTLRFNAKIVERSSLIDSARRAQAQVGKYVPYVLHHLCTQILSGPPAPGVRDAFKPGVWAMIEAMEVNDENAVRILSSAMNVSERAILRSLYEEWKTSGKWSGN